jgi:hypothetical protein
VRKKRHRSSSGTDRKESTLYAGAFEFLSFKGRKAKVDWGR